MKKYKLIWKIMQTLLFIHYFIIYPKTFERKCGPFVDQAAKTTLRQLEHNDQKVCTSR